MHILYFWPTCHNKTQFWNYVCQRGSIMYVTTQARSETGGWGGARFQNGNFCRCLELRCEFEKKVDKIYTHREIFSKKVILPKILKFFRAGGHGLLEPTVWRIRDLRLSCHDLARCVPCPGQGSWPLDVDRTFCSYIRATLVRFVACTYRKCV